MADTKITALTALTAADPANDVIPIVDVSDTSMAASGTTKKISVNNILGASGTATLASATITGDLTVDTSTLKVDSTNDRVGIGQATPSYKLHVQGNAGAQLVLQSNDTDATAKEGTVSARHYTNAEEPISTVGGFATSTNNYVYLGGGFSGGNAATFLGFHTAANNTTVTGTERYRIDSSGISIWSVAGTTAMTLNSTGLGIGTSPATKLDVRGANNASQATFSGTASRGLLISTRSDGLADDRTVILNAQHSTGSLGQLVIQTAGTDRLLVDNAGNVGIGVTPSAWRNTQRALQFGAVGTLFSNVASAGGTCIGRNVYESTTGDFTYIVNDEATFYEQSATGTHAWYTAAAGTGTISFGDAKMTLDASGNLILLSSNTPATLATNGQLTVNATSNTNLRFSYRGSDGTTRVANITLA